MGTPVLIGMLPESLFDVVRAQGKCGIETVFRYANVYKEGIALISSGKVNPPPLVSATFPFGESVKAFERAAEFWPSDTKLQVQMRRGRRSDYSGPKKALETDIRLRFN